MAFLKTGGIVHENTRKNIINNSVLWLALLLMIGVRINLIEIVFLISVVYECGYFIYVKKKTKILNKIALGLIAFSEVYLLMGFVWGTREENF